MRANHRFWLLWKVLVFKQKVVLVDDSFQSKTWWSTLAIDCWIGDILFRSARTSYITFHTVPSTPTKNLDHLYSLINHRRTTVNLSNHIFCENWWHPPSPDPRRKREKEEKRKREKEKKGKMEKGEKEKKRKREKRKREKGKKRTQEQGGVSCSILRTLLELCSS